MSKNVYDYTKEYYTLVGVAKRIFINMEIGKCTYIKTKEDKYNFRAVNLKEVYDYFIKRLRKITQNITDPVFFRDAETLLAVPSKKLEEDEFLIHRIWLGGSINDSTKKTLEQWENALNFLKNKTEIGYKSILWVWDDSQLSNDYCFEKKTTDDKYTIGVYNYNGVVVIVNSLHELIKGNYKNNEIIYRSFNECSFFCFLSDILRLFVINEYGGIYIDCDTMPHRSITKFLINPEVPNYHRYNITPKGEKLKTKITWMNFYKDENGALVTKKNNNAISTIIKEIELVIMNQGYACVAKGMSQESMKDLHASVYEIWRREIGSTLTSYYDLEYENSTLLPEAKETIASGIKGARITKNHVDNVYLPLSEVESNYFNSCVKNLESLNWELKDIKDLEKYAEIDFINERPRALYHPQLRHSIYHFNFYSFMSEDKNLNKLNEMYCKYVLNNLDEDISKGGFWLIPGCIKEDENGKKHLLRNVSDYEIISGDSLNDKHINEMARMIFSTSYLEFCSHSNKLRLPFNELQKRQNILPYIKLANALVNTEDELIAFIISGPMNDFKLISPPSLYRDEMESMDKNYEHFLYKNSNDSDYFISSVCVASQYRNKGMFNQLLDIVKKNALNKNLNRITLTVWESNEALDIYIRKGFKIVDYSDFAYDFFYDRIIFLSLELK